MAGLFLFMKLYLTFLDNEDYTFLKRISTSPPEEIDQETVFVIDWDGISDIPTEPTGEIYEGTVIESNYKEDGIIRMRSTGELKLCVNGELIPMPDDFVRFNNTYSGGKLVESVRLNEGYDCLF